MKDLNKEKYIQFCTQEVKKFMSEHKVLVHYTRNDAGNRSGVIVAFEDTAVNPPIVFVSWSAVHEPKDKFNKYIGLYKAITRPIDSFAEIPFRLESEIVYMQERAQRYFKQAVKTQILPAFAVSLADE